MGLLPDTKKFELIAEEGIRLARENLETQEAIRNLLEQILQELRTPKIHSALDAATLASTTIQTEDAGSHGP